jgi:hypothetical protein
MSKPFKHYTTRHQYGVRELADLVGANRPENVEFHLRATSKAEAAEYLGKALNRSVRDFEMEILRSPAPRLDATLTPLLEASPPGTVLAMSGSWRDGEAVVAWEPDPDAIPGMESSLEFEQPPGRWVHVAEIDDGTRPRFSLTTLRGMDLSDEGEVRRFFHAIGVVVLD